VKLVAADEGLRRAVGLLSYERYRDGVVELTGPGVGRHGANRQVHRDGLRVSLLELLERRELGFGSFRLPVGVGPDVFLAVDRVVVRLDPCLGRAAVIAVLIARSRVWLGDLLRGRSLAGGSGGWRRRVGRGRGCGRTAVAAGDQEEGDAREDENACEA